MEKSQNETSPIFYAKIYIYILILILSFANLKAQNLVPNSGFEDYYFCPKGTTYLDSACKEWFTPLAITNVHSPPYADNTGSSDYFNICATHPMCGVPKNAFGFQIPKSGNAYSGIALSVSVNSYVTHFDTYKEYIEIELSQFLDANSDYCFELYYSIANQYIKYYGTTDTILYKPVQIGIILTDTIVKRFMQSGIAQPLNICATPDFETSLVPYKDTVNWIHIQGNFKAKGGERYLTIGNFECNPTNYNPDSVAVYIYIDDVKLYKCNPDSGDVVDSLIIPNVFTPNGDGYNDKFDYKNQEQWEFETRVFNRWEVPVFDNHNSKNWDGTFEGTKVSSGVYFYIVRATAIKTGKVVVYRGTVTVLY